MLSEEIESEALEVTGQNYERRTVQSLGATAPTGRSPTSSMMRLDQLREVVETVGKSGERPVARWHEEFAYLPLRAYIRGVRIHDHGSNLKP